MTKHSRKFREWLHALDWITASNLDRRAYGFEIKKDFHKQATNLIKTQVQKRLF